MHISDVANKCTANVQEKRPKFYDNIVPGVLGDVVDLLCNQRVKTLEACQANEPEKLKSVIGLLSAEHLPKRNYSVGYALLNLLTYLEKAFDE